MKRAMRKARVEIDRRMSEDSQSGDSSVTFRLSRIQFSWQQDSVLLSITHMYSLQLNLGLGGGGLTESEV